MVEEGAIWMVQLLRAESGEKEPQVGLAAPEDGRPTTEAEVMILPLTSDEPLILASARIALGSGSHTQVRCVQGGSGKSRAPAQHPHPSQFVRECAFGSRCVFASLRRFASAKVTHNRLA
jgi:hypothetical protein